MPTQAARRRSVRNLGLSRRWALWLAWPVWIGMLATAAGGTDTIEVGTSVYLTADAQGRDGDRIIPCAAFWQPCWVEAIDGDRLWLEQGWVDRRDVLTPAQAVDYYSRRIEQGPASATDYLQRAMARGTLGEHDAASADFEAARRLDPALERHSGAAGRISPRRGAADRRAQRSHPVRPQMRPGVLDSRPVSVGAIRAGPGTRGSECGHPARTRAGSLVRRASHHLPGEGAVRRGDRRLQHGPAL